MRQIVPTMMVAVMLFLAGGSSRVYGQEACTFKQGFAELRALIGEQNIGACIENEHFNAENGNAEQQTTNGLMVWRKIDNFTAYTDGTVTWINGPNGLEARPNNVRLAWELDPVSPGAAPAATPKPLPTLPVTTPISPGSAAAPRVINDGGSIGTPNYTGQSGSGTTPPPLAATSTATPTAGSPTGAAASAASAPAVPPPPGAPAPAPAPGAPAAATAPTSATPATAAAPAAAAPVAAAAPTSEKEKEKPTKTPTPKPAVTAKFSERPEDVDTAMGGKNIDDGKCEWKFTLPADTKTGKAKAVVIVTAAEGTTTIEDTFEVKKGDTVFAGSVDLDVDPIDMPDDTVNPGAEIKIGIDTNLKRKGSCDLTLTWPKVGVVAGESQMPDDSGKCAWKMTVPAEAPRNSSANLLVTVRKDGSTVRTLSRDFKVAK